MLKTTTGAEDGFTVRAYVEGRKYELGPAPRALELAKVFIAEKLAVAADAPPEAAKPDVTDDAPPAPSPAVVQPTPPAQPPPPPPKKGKGK